MRCYMKIYIKVFKSLPALKISCNYMYYRLKNP